MRKFDLALRSSRSSYFATFRHQLTILSKTDELDEENWLNMFFPTRRSSDLPRSIPWWYAYVHVPQSARIVAERLKHAVFVFIAEMYLDRKSTRLNSSHQITSYAVFCLKKKKSPKLCLLP